MNYYQITFNNFEGFDPNRIHQFITVQMGLSDWWHFIPSTYIVESASTNYFMASRIIEVFPGLNFIIVKIDINDYNGYLDKRAWEWLENKIKSHSRVKTTYVPHVRSPLADLLSGVKTTSSSSSTSNVDAARRALKELLSTKIK